MREGVTSDGQNHPIKGPKTEQVQVRSIRVKHTCYNKTNNLQRKNIKYSIERTIEESYSRIQGFHL